MPRDLSYPPLPEPLEVATYDNHTHLDLGLGGEVSVGGAHGLSTAPLGYREQLDRAERVGIRGIVQVGTDVESSRWAAETAAVEPRMLAAVAIHPNEAPDLELAGVLDDALAQIAHFAARPRVRAVGETGLDHFRTAEDGWDAQRRSFEAHIDIAKQNDIALQIHDRDAHDDVVETLKRVGAPARTVFHCFSGGPELAEICAQNGWYLSFAGNVTFKNAQNLRDALAVAPRELILVETDAPFLTPEPNRGRTNAPYLVPYTVRAMAGYLAVEPSALAAQLTANTEAVYGAWDAEPVATAHASPAGLSSAGPASAGPSPAGPSS